MKKMTCRQLGGACEQVFIAATFDDMAAQSQQHGKEMYRQGDPAHLEAMNKMRELMQSPQAMQEWMNERRKEFENLSDE